MRSKSTALIRIRFPREAVARLDQLREQLLGAIKRPVSRAALVRALVLTRMDAHEDRGELAEAIGADPVKRGGGRRRMTRRLEAVERRIPVPKQLEDRMLAELVGSRPSDGGSDAG